MKEVLTLGLLLMAVLTLTSYSGQASAEVECEDIKGEMDWDSEGHDDNNPDESDFYDALEEKTFCEVLKDIDHMNIEGEIKEDSKHDMDWLEGTIFYASVDDKSVDCMRDAYFDSPDSDGDSNLADYEMLECTY